MTQHPKLFKYDNAGRLREWGVEQYVDSYRTHAGIVGGAIVVSAWTDCEGNIQRPNSIDQCDFEIGAMYEHRLKRTYHMTAEGAKEGAHHFEPMLAYELDRKRLSTLSLPVYGKQQLPRLYVQPKLDGMRCIATAAGLFTRQGVEIVSAPHIMCALNPYFDMYPDTILDGELYSDALSANFNKIMSLARKKKGLTPAQLAKSEKYLEFHIYDVPTDERYKARQQDINIALVFVEENMPFGMKSPLRAVETVGISSWAEWDDLHVAWCEAGYEGSMGRTPEAPYQNKRTRDLIKRKDFDEQEFDIAAFGEGEGNWAGAVKRVLCWLPDTPEVQRLPRNATDPRFTFTASPRGTHSDLHNLLMMGKDDPALPTVATVKFLGWTTTDNPKPRHPIAKQLFVGPRDT